MESISLNGASGHVEGGSFQSLVIIFNASLSKRQGEVRYKSALCILPVSFPFTCIWPSPLFNKVCILGSRLSEYNFIVSRVLTGGGVLCEQVQK